MRPPYAEVTSNQEHNTVVFNQNNKKEGFYFYCSQL